MDVAFCDVGQRKSVAIKERVHIHHLRPRIPNYFLERCQEETPAFQAIPPVTLLSSLKSLPLRLYSEEDRQLVGFRHLRTLRKK